MSLFDSIKYALKAVWEFIKKITIKIVNFVDNIVNWFKSPDRLKKLQDDKEILAVAIKEKLDNGSYNVVNCLYNRHTNEIVDFPEDVLSITANSLDTQTLSKFGDKEMILIQ